MSWVSVGEFVGSLYFGWAVLALAGCFGPHLFIALLYAVPGGRAAPAVHVLELVYGLFHPIFYLLVIQPRLAAEWSPWWLLLLEWGTLAAYWGLRCWGDPMLLRDPWRVRVRQFLGWCFVLIASLGARDIALARSRDEQMLGSYAPFFIACLYALPLFAVSGQWRALSWEQSDRVVGFGFLRFSRKVGLGAALLGATLLISGMHASEAETRALIDRNRELIRSTAEARRLDPRLLTAILSVTQQRTLPRMQVQLENAVIDLWLSDPRTRAMIGEAIEPSLGIAQIKADAVLKASALDQVPRPGSGGRLPDKQRVVLSLRTEAGNIEALGFLLDTYATQWERTNAAWSIRERPEIIATLFQLGLSRSHPHGDPQPNEFGRRVLAEMQAPWIAERFEQR